MEGIRHSLGELQADAERKFSYEGPTDVAEGSFPTADASTATANGCTATPKAGAPRTWWGGPAEATGKPTGG